MDWHRLNSCQHAVAGQDTHRDDFHHGQHALPRDAAKRFQIQSKPKEIVLCKCAGKLVPKVNPSSGSKWIKEKNSETMKKFLSHKIPDPNIPDRWDYVPWNIFTLFVYMFSFLDIWGWLPHNGIVNRIDTCVWPDTVWLCLNWANTQDSHRQDTWIAPATEEPFHDPMPSTFSPSPRNCDHAGSLPVLVPWSNTAQDHSPTPVTGVKTLLPFRQ